MSMAFVINRDLIFILYCTQLANYTWFNHQLSLVNLSESLVYIELYITAKFLCTFKVFIYILLC